MPEELGPETPELQSQVNEAIEEQIRELKEEQKTEKAKEKKDSQWFNLIGLSTGIISTLAAIAAMRGGYLANEATLNQMKANDQWGLYQAASTKRHIEQSTVEVLQALQKPIPLQTKQSIQKFLQQQSNSKSEAEKLQAESEENLRQHELFAASVAGLQISISLSAIAALVRRKSVWYLGLAVATIGVIAMIAGFLPASKQPNETAKTAIPQ
jgi:heme/copper-type cytochrome/quinol oxidase subunit 4